MNTDDNEKYLAQKAMQGVGMPQTKKGAIRFTGGLYGVFNAPAVKRVKGFDASTQKAAHKKNKRAKAHQKRLAAAKR